MKKTMIGANQGKALALPMFTLLFFMWGFITCLNDILIPHLKNVFSLSYTQAMLIQFCFFGAYFLVSLPAGRFVHQFGYKVGVVTGLVVSGMGCLLFYPAASLPSYPFFLAALFILASGITLLQVSANPYVASMGSPETAASRLTMTQAFNSLGTTVAPFFGAALILSFAGAGSNAATNIVETQHSALAVQKPYLLLAACFGLLALMFAWFRMPSVSHGSSATAHHQSDNVYKPAWHYRHLVLGVVCIFLYVGAEVAIGSFLISFIGQPHIAGFDEAQAAHYVAYYWGGAMVGRFAGAVFMQRIHPGIMLAFNGLASSILVLLAIISSGPFAMWCMLLVGLCNSIMFPTIFSLAIHQLGGSTSQGSGLLCLAIVGGALIPLLQGAVADSVGVQLAFILPLCCYVYIVFYGLFGSKPRQLVTES